MSKESAAALETTLAMENTAGVSNAKDCGIGNIRMLNTGVELVCNGGSFGWRYH